MKDLLVESYEADIVQFKPIPFVQHSFKLFFLGIGLFLIRKYTDIPDKLNINPLLLKRISDVLGGLGILGIVLGYISNTLYYITGSFKCDTEKLTLKNHKNESLQLSWSDIQDFSMKKLSRRFIELRFDGHHVYLRFRPKERRDFEKLLKEKGLI